MSRARHSHGFNLAASVSPCQERSVWAATAARPLTHADGQLCPICYLDVYSYPWRRAYPSARGPVWRPRFPPQRGGAAHDGTPSLGQVCQVVMPGGPPPTARPTSAPSRWWCVRCGLRGSGTVGHSGQVLLDVTRMTVPPSRGFSRHGATVVFGWPTCLRLRGGDRLGVATGTYHVFKGCGEPQPARERIDGLAVEQPPTQRVGALLELEGDAHRPGLVHIGQRRRRGRRAASRRHRCFLSPVRRGGGFGRG